MRVRVIRGLLAPEPGSNSGTVSFDPHKVTGASETQFAAVGATGAFASTPAAIVSLHDFVVSDKDSFLGSTEQDVFNLSETVTASNLKVSWSSTGGSKIRQISYLVIGEVSEPVASCATCGNLRRLGEFGEYSTVASAQKTLSTALAQMTQAGGGTLCIPLDAPKYFHPRNLVQATPSIQTASVTPGVTVLDLRSGSELRYVPPIGTVLSDGQRACWGVERDLAQNVTWQDVWPTANITSRYTGGASSYNQALQQDTLNKANRYYVPTLRGLFVGQAMIVNGSQGGQWMSVKSLGIDAVGPYFVGDAANFDYLTTNVDYPKKPRVYNKNVVNGLTVTDSSNCDNQSASVYVNRATYGNGDSFGIAALLSYQGTIMSGGGDEGSVAVNAEIRHDLDCFWAAVESYDTQLHHLVYRPEDGTPASPIATGKLGTSRPLINMNEQKWTTSGRVAVIAPGYTADLRPSDDVGRPLVIGNQAVGWDESVVGQFIAIDEPSEYYKVGEATAGSVATRRVYRWWFITAISPGQDGFTNLYVEETWWDVATRSGPILFKFENYTIDRTKIGELKYIIAPGAWVSDVRDGVSSWELGHQSATAEDRRLIVLAPSSTDGASLPDGTSLDFEPNDPITNALGANVWKPTGVRVRHFDNFPGSLPGYSYIAENLGTVQLGAGLFIDSVNARTLKDAAKNQKDGEPGYLAGISVYASTVYALLVSGDVKAAAINFAQRQDGNPHKIQWHVKDGASGATLHADPKSGHFIFSGGDIFTGGNVNHQGRGSLKQSGISATETPANNLRGINVSVPAGTASLDITLPVAEWDVTYAVSVTCSWATTTAVTAKGTTGFTVALGTPPPAAGGTLDWLLVR
jgi:hypothetical protein